VCTEDEQCAIDNFCWFKNPADAATNTRKCMALYSGKTGMKFGWRAVFGTSLEPLLKDFEQNGKACETGLAF
jgi:hypothetical protein